MGFFYKVALLGERQVSFFFGNQLQHNTSTTTYGCFFDHRLDVVLTAKVVILFAHKTDVVYSTCLLTLWLFWSLKLHVDSTDVSNPR